MPTTVSINGMGRIGRFASNVIIIHHTLNAPFLAHRQVLVCFIFTLIYSSQRKFVQPACGMVNELITTVLP